MSLVATSSFFTTSQARPIPRTEPSTTPWVAPGKPLSKIDAKGQKVLYTYDSSLRVTQIQRYPAPGNVEDQCQRTTYSYDTNNGGFSQSSSYRLTAVTYGTPMSLLSTGGACGSSVVPYNFTDMYSYTPAGAVSIKRLAVTANIITPGQAATLRTVNLDTSQTYDNEGKVLTVKYPDAWAQNIVTGAYGIQTGRTYTYTYTYDTMGRPTQLTDDMPSPVTWVNNVQYGPRASCCRCRTPPASASGLLMGVSCRETTTRNRGRTKSACR